ncbi:PREDICTED: uncharacterized protein LOC107170792 [Diuraphis noxia]|uniref:uncharacterized protein LOC107170792 n=1 Tax=Diuraphis noxia TaxID=143948 RepID=UPI00076379D2|nr:PREDICTED: uncharacterized protein LOC107170792 [Diuraphis noxia]
MAGSIEDNVALYKMKTFIYVPPSPPVVLIDSTSYTLDFGTRKFIHIGIDPSSNFKTVLHILTSSRYVYITSDFMKKIFSFMGHILSFILDSPLTYKRIIFLESDSYKLSSMVYNKENVLVIESKTEDGCRVLLNRGDLIQLQKLEWSIYSSIQEKDINIKPKILNQMNQYSEYILLEKIPQVDSPPENAHEMYIFINNVEDMQSSRNHFISQIKLCAPTQLAELCMARLKTQNSPESYDKNFNSLSVMSPSYSPVNAAVIELNDDSSARDGFDHSGNDTLAKEFDQIDAPLLSADEILSPQSVDENDGPDFYNRSWPLSPSMLRTPLSSQSSLVEHPAPFHKRSRSKFTRHSAPSQNVIRKLF